MENLQFHKDPLDLSEWYNSSDFEKDYFYPGKLGAIYDPLATTFRVWAPIAQSVSLCLYQAGAGMNLIQKNVLQPVERGVWELTLNGDFEGTYYTYEVTNFKTAAETADPFAKAVGVNGLRSMVVNLLKTDPAGWKDDAFQRPMHQTDAVVWEVHVRDFSSDPDCGVREDWRGKYLAFTETDTTLPDGQTPTCVNYLKKLGVTHIQLMPVYDFSSIDESQPGKSFNWGYDPLNYNVPEGSYSTDPFHGGTRITEFKQMVASLHQAGIGVVIDVVYNHTFETMNSWFHRIVPYYYHRITPNGQFANGSACGNEVASERCMCRKYIVDSVLYWVKEYHIDGFRFDLMGLIDVETMNCVRDALDGLPDGRKILLYGEPWYASEPSMQNGRLPADKNNVKSLNSRIGVFSDFTRDAIRGDVFIKHKKGFVQGDLKFENSVKASLQGWTRDDFARPFAVAPTQVISYISAHDNQTLWDKLISSTKRGRNYEYDEEIARLNKLCAVLNFMAQGMHFLQAGEEFARTKRGMDNSFRASPSRNRLDWKRTFIFSDLHDYYRGLIQIRAAFPVLRDPTTSAAAKMKFSDSAPGTIACTLSDAAGTLAVCVNVLPKPVEISLNCKRSETWAVLADGVEAGIHTIRTIQGNDILLPEKTAFILKLKKAPI